jgi:hypothetical protein
MDCEDLQACRVRMQLRAGGGGVRGSRVKHYLAGSMRQCELVVMV